MTLARAALVVTLSLAGCKEKNPNFCADSPDNLCSDGGIVEECSAADPTCAVGVCKVESEKCVECLVNSDCTAAAPICDSGTNLCSPCTAHTECESRACMPGGECAMASAVAYVTGVTGDDNGMCTDIAPCRSVTRALTTGRRIIKLSGMVDDPVVFDNTPSTIVLADPDTRLTRTGGGPIIDVKGTSNITIHDLQIAGASGGAGGIGVTISGGSPTLALVNVRVNGNQGRGVVVNAGTISIQRSMIFENDAGGLAILAAQKVVVESTIIANNGRSAGTSQSTLGAGTIEMVTDVAGSRFQSNTVVANQNSVGSLLPAGLACQVTALSAAGNIFYANVHGTSSDASQQKAGGCDFGNSFASAPVAGDLGFNLTSNPPQYHLVATSPATVLDVGGTCPMLDFDGEERPMNGACDLGADELTAP
ncbi:MAG: right-handed parallel beta-helix repeat-containing protein [Deltaproteobacteria bacterium]|nr:right-handed parallel beta-helix repeat-containing protein [Deltaproteobacteria bacterium]MDQ3298257.1 hypothetical protein [Myxococcota bacterium]